MIFKKHAVLLNFILKESWKKSIIFWSIMQKISRFCFVYFLYFWPNKCILFFWVFLPVKTCHKPHDRSALLAYVMVNIHPNHHQVFLFKSKLQGLEVILLFNTICWYLCAATIQNQEQCFWMPFYLYHALHHIQSIIGYLKLVNK